MDNTESKSYQSHNLGPEKEAISGRLADKASESLLYARTSKKFSAKQSVYRLISFLVVMVVASSFSLFLLMFPSDFEISSFNKFFTFLDFKVVVVVISLFAGLLLAVVLQYEVFREGRRSSLSFVELDERESYKRSELDIIELERQLKQLRGAKNNEHSFEQSASVAEELKDELYEYSAIENYIGKLTKSLDRHIELSEIKASKLLDTGTLYLRRGIYFYVLSIFVWQVVAYFRGVDSSLIYGVVSCSLTFLVVEFLAAWFLKQYRNFIDSSVQFMKVKSVFDRYMLSYYAVKEFSVDGAEGVAEAKAQVLKVLAEEIKWPEPLGSKTGDMNHMVQMFESLAVVLDKVKNVTAKNEKGGS